MDSDNIKVGDSILIDILDRQKKDLVVRFLKKHEEVEANKTFIDKIMSNLSDLIVVLSADLKIVQANKEFYKILELKEQETDLSLGDITGQESLQLLTGRLSAGEFQDMETTLISHSGKPVPVIIRGTTYVTESGRILHMLVASDRRDFYEVMGRMREVQDQLIHSGRLASLGEMAAGIGHEGMGLGLSIVERIVRGFGGHIKVTSTPHSATTFTVYLPEYTNKQSIEK